MSTSTVHMFWAYGAFSQLELLCVNSFVKQGHDLWVWTYDRIGNCPKGATLRDANEILPESSVFTYKNGSIAAFANLFRYALLMKHGGLYVDTDVIALRDASSLPTHSYLVTEKTKQQSAIRINNNVIHCPSPEHGNIIDLALAFAKQFPTEKLEWGDTGPKLLTVLHQAYPKVSFQLMPPSFANPVNWWECPVPLLAANSPLPEAATFLHCFNEMWRRRGIDKNAPYPKGSLMAEMALRFL